MYLWKAWHDCRARVVLYIIATVSVAVLSGMELIARANYHRAFLTLHPYAAQLHSGFYNYSFELDITFWTLHGTVLGSGLAWNLANFSLLWEVFGFGSMVMLLAALSLGASGVGREYGAGTMNSVLTRPAPRRNFILTDWVVGLTGLVIILSGLAFPLLPFLYAIQAKGPGNILAGLPALWVLGAAIFGLSHFTTLVSGSASKGLTLSAATLLTYSFLPWALHEWWHKDAPFKAAKWTLGAFDWDAWPLSPFNWGATVFWLAVAAGFLAASLAWIRWREV
jgi:ABC-type transport system involved in multi-copper enzyme maturation permease subunit